MKKRWKKLMGILLAATLLVSAAACGKEQKNTETKNETAAEDTKKEDEKEEKKATGEVDGTLKSFVNGELTITDSKKQDYIFAITSKAEITCKTMLAGDNLNVIYEGTVTGTDTSKATVIKVEDKGASTVTQQELVGTVSATSANTVSVKTNEGNEYTFSTIGAKLEYKNGVENGNWVHVTYTGTINGTDTSGVKVIKIVDDSDNIKEEQNKVVIHDVNENVWATTAVNVRESYTTESNVLGSLIEGDEVTRNGVCDNGWSRVVYHGTDAYIYSDYLTTTEPAQPTQPAPPNPAPAPAQPVPQAEQFSTAGYVTRYDNGMLTIMVHGIDFSFNIQNAAHNYTNGLLIGNEVTVVYTGDITDSENAVVISVTDTDANENNTSTITGYIQTASMNVIQLGTEDAAVLTISIMDAAVNVDGGLQNGEKVTVTLDLTQTVDESNMFYATAVDAAN